LLIGILDAVITLVVKFHLLTALLILGVLLVQKYDKEVEWKKNTWHSKYFLLWN
jgi:hypothetical protein